MRNVFRLKVVRNLGFLLLFLYIGSLVRDQILYERWLQSSSVTWEDFSREYAEALRESVEERHPLKYDNYPPLTNSSDKIPPTIHFIWFRNLYDAHLDVSKIPTMGSDAPDLCRKYNPDFEIHIWNKTAARDLIEEHYSWFIPTYDQYKHPIQRVDAFKYFLLHHYGGIYMDLDISCRRPLNPLLEFPAWFPKAQPFGVNNDLMASRAGHPIMGKMIEMLRPRDKNLLFPYLTIFWSTGPQFTSDILKAWFLKQIRTGRSSGLSKENFDADSILTLPLPFYSERYTFFGHSPGGTWHGGDVAVILWLVNKRWFVFGSLFLLALLTMTITMRRRIFRGKLKRRRSEPVDPSNPMYALPRWQTYRPAAKPQ